MTSEPFDVDKALAQLGQIILNSTEPAAYLPQLAGLQAQLDALKLDAKAHTLRAEGVAPNDDTADR